MFDTLATLEFWITSISLFTAIWLKVRLTQTQSYRLGATQGFALGISYTLKAVSDKKLVKELGVNGVPLTEDELIQEVTPQIMSELAKELKPKV